MLQIHYLVLRKGCFVKNVVLGKWNLKWSTSILPLSLYLWVYLTYKNVFINPVWVHIIHLNELFIHSYVVNLLSIPEFSNQLRISRPLEWYPPIPSMECHIAQVAIASLSDSDIKVLLSLMNYKLSWPLVESSK